MENCIFCKIIDGEVDSAKIWENEKFVAIFDVNPNVQGMTLVLSKQHYDSYVFDMPDELYVDFMLASRSVARILEKVFDISRVSLVMEGMGVDHAHIKLYPLHGIKEKFKEMWSKDRIFFEKYEGYLSTQLGPEANMDELKELAQKIREKNQQ